MTRLAVAAIVFLLVFMVFTTVFAASAKKSEVRLLPKWAWVLLCLLVPFFGGLLYIMVGRPLRSGPAKPSGKRKVVAPDDDPTFLRDIAKKLREEDEGDKDKDKDQK